MKFKLKNYGFGSEEEFEKAIKEYYASGISQNEIAEKIGCKRHTIIKAFKHFRIKTENRNSLHIKCGFQSAQELADNFQKLYNDGLSQREIAKKFDICVVSVSKYFKKYGIKSRTNKESLAILQKDVLLSHDEEQVIYGLLLGNGTLTRKAYTASLKYYCLHEEAVNPILEALRRLSPSFRFKMSINTRRYRIHTLSYMCLAQIYDEWHPDKMKSIPDNIDLTPEICYWWYVNDGVSSTEALKIVTTIDETNMEQLISKMPVKCAWYKERGIYPTIYIPNHKDRIEFLKFMGPCRHESYAYKWKIYSGYKVFADLSGIK